MALKRKYIDSHWLVFIFQGAISLLFGCLTLFTSDKYLSGLVLTSGIFLMSLAIIEFANSLYRTHRREGWLVSLLVAIFDAVFGLALVFLVNEGMVWQLSLVSAYTFFRGIFEIVISFRTTVDPTDRFIWLFCGLAGIVFGLVIFNSGHLENIEFMRFFGAYMMILGTSSLIYGVHNREQAIEDREARSLAAREGKKATKMKAKKSSKKS